MAHSPLPDDSNSTYLSDFLAETLTSLSDVHFHESPRALTWSDVDLVDERELPPNCTTNGPSSDSTNPLLEDGEPRFTTYLCMRTFTESRRVGSFVTEQLPFNFYVRAQISPTDCFLLPATDGGGGFFNLDRSERRNIASFWVEERPDHVSRTEWVRTMDNIHRLAMCSGIRRTPGTRIPRDTSNLYRNEAGAGVAKLRLEWVPMETQTEDFPLVDRHEQHIGPYTGEDSLTGVPVTVLFALKCDAYPRRSFPGELYRFT
ncbi:hypothetical protein EIP91_002661 [Steccherinum ochraceum]|uniref:Uncharacterized protein n=1 Tax=Steccherinum ochraceum TaxID=92696 RepID=A0A4R0RNL2_9APHY|nr:hypothetical protein EIP91_002661 [Steccherinum ochraceum]